MNCRNILIGVTGSVATIKLQQLIKSFEGNNIKIVATARSRIFIDDSITLDVISDQDEWSEYKIGDKILHIELRNWADVFLIAPLSANTLGKIANGLCDNLVTCIVRAWDLSKRLILCPAMNTAMYDHPITRVHLDLLEEWGYVIIYPIAKNLACGDYGTGAMENVDQISSIVKRFLNQ